MEDNVEKLRRRAAKCDLKITKDKNGFYDIVYVGTGERSNYVVASQLPDLDEVARWLDIWDPKESD